MAVFDVVGVNGAEALQRGRGERDAGGAADVLQLLHQTDALLEHAAEERRLSWLESSNNRIMFFCPLRSLKVQARLKRVI